MIRNFLRRISSLPSIAPPPSFIPTIAPPPPFIPTHETINFLFPDNNEPKPATVTPSDSDDGYRILVDVCHHTKTIYIDNDMSDYDKLNDLPRIIKTFGCLYPNYTLQGNDA